MVKTALGRVNYEYLPGSSKGMLVSSSFLRGLVGWGGVVRRVSSPFQRARGKERC